MVVCWVGCEGDIEAVVDFGDVLLEVGACFRYCEDAMYSMFGWNNLRIPGNLRPDTPTMLRLPTLPRRRRSKRVRPTTPTFLSDVEAVPPT